MEHFDFCLSTMTGHDGRDVRYFRLPALEEQGLGSIGTLPYSVRILLESLLRNQGHPAFEARHVQALAGWSPRQKPEEFPFLPARVLLQDFTGVPCVVDLAALRDALRRAGKDPSRIEPQIPVDLVIDHSVQLDAHARPDALQVNMQREFERNNERYAFLRWGQSAFRNLRIIPPGLGICHQVNLEYLATCVTVSEQAGVRTAFPDTLVGTDSHTTMINGLGILGWGVGGIEAEAAMLGQPIPLLSPSVVGVRLTGELRSGATATDLALTVTRRLREKGVVGQFVEFYGPGVDRLTLADRATVANMAPEYGATTGFFPVDAETIRYLRQTGRPEAHLRFVEAYCRAQGLFRAPTSPEPVFTSTLDVDVNDVEACVAGPKRPHDYMALSGVRAAFRKALIAPVREHGYGLPEPEVGRAAQAGDLGTLRHGSVILASITSCTNTSNPSVMIAAGLLAQRAVARGLRVPPFVKTSLAPGSRVVTAYLKQAGLLEPLEKLGFHVAAYGCATCIGNSGPLDKRVEQAIKNERLIAAAVLSGNRNFEGRVHPQAKANYLCSPPLVVAYALAGTLDIDLTTEPLGRDAQGQPVFLKDLWPTQEDIRGLLQSSADPELYRGLYQHIAECNPAWNAIRAEAGPVYEWDPASTYIRNPNFISEIGLQPDAVTDIQGARALAWFGDFITTDHISPAGSIPQDSPAGQYLVAQGVPPGNFNSYGARRGNHEVMVRGTFANVRIRNRLVDREGGWTLHGPEGTDMRLYDAAMMYRKEQVPLIVIAGKMYGAGSSRDWAAKGTHMLGVKAVIAESFERIHRSNLVEMGIWPLEFLSGQNADSLGLNGREVYTIRGMAAGLQPGQMLEVAAVSDQGTKSFQVRSRVDSGIEADYMRQGGILPFVLREFF